MKNSLGQEICMICFAVIDPPAQPEARFREICPSCKHKLAHNNPLAALILGVSADPTIENRQSKIQNWRGHG